MASPNRVSETRPALPNTPAKLGTTSGLKDRVAPFVAVLLLIAFAGALVVLFVQLGMPQQQWDRAMYLLNGVEAVAFAAAGYLFGTEVHRQRADAAEEQVKQEHAHAQAAQHEATKGRELAGMVKGAAMMAGQGALESLDDSPEPGSLRLLAAEARKLFPDESRNPA